MAAQFRDSELTVELILSESLPQIWADRERMAQVLTNLLSNAARYTPPGGRVIVAGRHDRKSVEIAVTDTGVGIPPEHQGRIFQKFARLDLSRPRPRGSTGLGLSITKSLVESMSGTISLESGVGVGSTFRVNMPAAPHQAS
jgi:signal transduction histidine kinase